MGRATRATTPERRLCVYCIATPIGDYLSDFSLNALRLIRRLPILFVENTLTPGDDLIARLKSRGLISDDQKLIELTESSIGKMEIEFIDELVAARQSFGLMADRGLCCFLDPGLTVVRHLITRHADTVDLVPIGASSALDAALMISGVDCSRFVFLGHYPEVFFWPNEVIHQKIPLVAYVRGDSLCRFLDEARNEFATSSNLVLTLFRNIRGRMNRLRECFPLHHVGPSVIGDDQQNGFTAIIHAPWD